jgi:TetR/AcrR family transcriptional regulator, transcriptional repressor for nem operon
MTRGPDKKFDPEIALDKAMRLFWAKGYAATSLNELLETMEIGRKSLYDTFGNKRALYIKALDRYSQTIVADIYRALNNPNRPALENVRAVMHDIAVNNSKPESLGCLLGVSMAHFRTDDAEMAGVLRKHMLRVENAYYKAFATAQADGDLNPTTNVKNLARLFMSTHQGLTLIGRVTETQEVPYGIVDGALAVLETA